MQFLLIGVIVAICYDAYINTKLTIDDNFIRELWQKANETGSSFKEIVNKVLRSGLKEMDKPKPSKPYKCKTYSLDGSDIQLGEIA